MAHFHLETGYSLCFADNPVFQRQQPEIRFTRILILVEHRAVAGEARLDKIPPRQRLNLLARRGDGVELLQPVRLRVFVPSAMPSTLGHCHLRPAAARVSFLPEAAADQLLNILRLSERTFSSFLSGQCLEAVILGTMFFVSMTLLHFPYALLVGVLIALTALIPIVGAFIGCAVGALLMLVNDPWQALWFIVLFLVLQQIEGNLIYPHVVGSSVGLPSIWVLAAVTVGGNIMGIVGMLVFIPLLSVFYTIFREFVYLHLKKQHIKQVTATKIEEYTEEEIAAIEGKEMNRTE